MQIVSPAQDRETSLGKNSSEKDPEVLVNVAIQHAVCFGKKSPAPGIHNSESWAWRG